MKQGALFSQDRLHRYELWRVWDEKKPRAMFIGLNPSTADETKDDPTVRRCIGFAQRWGYGGLTMTNIFAYRSTDPHRMKEFHDPVGPGNNVSLISCAADAGVVVAAWGVHGQHKDRERFVYNMLQGFVQLKCLGQTKDGHPKHPLYLRADLEPVPFKIKEAAHHV